MLTNRRCRRAARRAPGDTIRLGFQKELPLRASVAECQDRDSAFSPRVWTSWARVLPWDWIWQSGWCRGAWRIAARLVVLECALRREAVPAHEEYRYDGGPADAMLGSLT